MSPNFRNRATMRTLTAETISLANRVQAGVVALLVAFSVMSYFDRTIMSIAAPDIIKEFGLSETQMGSVHFAFLITYALLMTPGGHLADLFGPRRVLTLMGLGAALLTGLTALAGRPGLGAYLGVMRSFILIRLLFGVFTAPLYPSCARMIANWVPLPNRARVWGFVAAGAGLGGAVSPFLFSQSITRFGWRISFWLSGAATAALAILWVWFVRDHPRDHPSVGPAGGRFLLREEDSELRARAGPTPWFRLLTDRNLMLLTFGYFATNYFTYIFFYWIYYYFGKIRQMQPGESVVYTTAIFLAWTVMSPLGGWVSDRLAERYGRKLGRRIVPVIGLILGAFMLFLGTNLSSPLATGIVLSLSLGFVSCSDGPFWASAIDLGGQEVGAAGGILNTGGNLGGSLAPFLTPLIASHFGWSWGLYIGCVAVTLGALGWFMIDPTQVIQRTDQARVVLESEGV